MKIENIKMEKNKQLYFSWREGWLEPQVPTSCLLRVYYTHKSELLKCNPRNAYCLCIFSLLKKWSSSLTASGNGIIEKNFFSSYRVGYRKLLLEHVLHLAETLQVIVCSYVIRRNREAKAKGRIDYKILSTLDKADFSLHSAGMQQALNFQLGLKREVKKTK